VLITGIAEEYRAVRAHLKDLREVVANRGTIYEIGLFEEWEVAVTQAGRGSTSMAFIAGAAVDLFRPEVLLFVGIAVGVHDAIHVGDVLVATEVGSLTGERGYGLRKSPMLPTHRLLQRARFEAMNSRWQRLRVDQSPLAREPTVAFGSLLAAMTVLSDISDVVHINLQPGTLAVDWNSYAALSALHAYKADVLVVRGICGRRDDINIIDNIGVEKAADNAAAFALEVLARLPRPQARGAPAATKQPPPELAYLTSLRMRNIRALANCHWAITPQEAPGWHVMLGDNGAGKSTLLRGAALALFDTRETEGLRLAWPSWLAIGADEGTIAITLASDARTSERALIIRRGATDAAQGVGPGESTNRSEPASVFSAGYGPFRRFSGGDLDYEKELDVYPRLVRHMSLFSERVALTESLAWLKDLRFKQLENDPEGELLTDVRGFLNNSGLLPNGVHLAEVSSEAVTFVDANGATVPIEELSDGFRSVLSLALDLLRHMAVVYGAGNLVSPVDPFRVVVAGIVFIDEVDVHLHPSWQHRIGDWFTAHFPAVQFIVATHSPIVCQGASSVFLLPQPGTEAHGRRLEGVELERVRNGNVLEAYGTGVFGHGVTRSEESRFMLRRLAELNDKELDGALTPEEQAEQEALRAVLPTRASVTEAGL